MDDSSGSRKPSTSAGLGDGWGDAPVVSTGTRSADVAALVFDNPARAYVRLETTDFSRALARPELTEADEELSVTPVPVTLAGARSVLLSGAGSATATSKVGQLTIEGVTFRGLSTTTKATAGSDHYQISFEGVVTVEAPGMRDITVTFLDHASGTLAELMKKVPVTHHLATQDPKVFKFHTVARIAGAAEPIPQGNGFKLDGVGIFTFGEVIAKDGYRKACSLYFHLDTGEWGQASGTQSVTK